MSDSDFMESFDAAYGNGSLGSKFKNGWAGILAASAGSPVFGVTSIIAHHAGQQWTKKT